MSISVEVCGNFPVCPTGEPPCVGEIPTMTSDINRRAFLATSSSAILAATALPGLAHQASRQLPTGPVYGRVGPRGIAPNSRGEVSLLDGTRLDVHHGSASEIAAGKSVWATRDDHGSFTVLYAEV